MATAKKGKVVRKKLAGGKKSEAIKALRVPIKDLTVSHPMD
jgi:hypothetical protein